MSGDPSLPSFTARQQGTGARLFSKGSDDLVGAMHQAALTEILGDLESKLGELLRAVAKPEGTSSIMTAANSPSSASNGGAVLSQNVAECRLAVQSHPVSKDGAATLWCDNRRRSKQRWDLPDLHDNESMDSYQRVERLSSERRRSSSATTPSKARMTRSAAYELRPSWQVHSLTSLPPTQVSGSWANATCSFELERPRHKRGHARLKTVRSIGKSRRLGSSPASNFRLVWESVGMAFMVYDLVMAPLEAFYAINTVTDPRFFALCTILTYWLCDMMLSFSLGYYVNGVLELRLGMTAKHYLKTWFVCDLSLLFVDVISTVLTVLQHQGLADNLGYVHASKVARVLKFGRLARLVKLQRFTAKLQQLAYSDIIMTMLHVSTVVVWIIAANHYVACGWYLIGASSTGSNNRRADSWVLDNFEQWDGFGYRYFTALHWSLTQFTPASMEVVPTNTQERAFTVCVIVMGVITFSTLIGSITEAMTQVRKLNAVKNKQQEALRQYFLENSVSVELAMRIWRYLEQGVKVRPERKMWSDVELLHKMPEVLRLELCQEVYLPALSAHPFFSRATAHCLPVMRSLVTRGIQEMSLTAEQELFNLSQLADAMWFVVDGSLNYKHHGSDDPKDLEIVPPGRWICEAALWVEWVHTGTMIADKLSILVSLPSTAMPSIFKHYPETLPRLVRYAELFVVYLNKNLQVASDLWDDPDILYMLSEQAFENSDSEVASVHKEDSDATGKRGNGDNIITRLAMLPLQALRRAAAEGSHLSPGRENSPRERVAM